MNGEKINKTLHEYNFRGNLASKKKQYFCKKIMKNLQCRSSPISHLVAAPDQPNLMPSGVAGLHWENPQSCQLCVALNRDSGLHHLPKEEVCRVATESLNAQWDSPEDPATRRKKTHIPEEVSQNSKYPVVPKDGGYSEKVTSTSIGARATWQDSDLATWFRSTYWYANNLPQLRQIWGLSWRPVAAAEKHHV